MANLYKPTRQSIRTAKPPFKGKNMKTTRLAKISSKSAIKAPKMPKPPKMKIKI